MSSEVVTVTPERAKRWLRTGCPILRRCSRHRIDALAKAMQDGSWDASRSVIILHRGALADGHGRLTASVRYGIAFLTTIERR